MAKALLLTCCFALITGFLSAQSHALYSVLGDTLVTLDLQTGDASSVGSIGGNLGEVGNLAYYPPTDQLLGIVNGTINPELLSFDRNTGIATSLGFIDLVAPVLNVQLCEGLAYDPVSGQMYVAVHENSVNTNWFYSNKLGVLDVSNGNITQVATVTGTLQDDIDGMVFRNGVLYAYDGNPSNRNFYTVNPVNGNANFVNFISHRIPDMAVDPVTNVLYGCSNGVRELVTINPNNAQVSVIGNTHSPTEYNGGRILGIAFAPSPDTLLAVVGTASNIDCFGNNNGSISITVINGISLTSFSLNGGLPSSSGNFNGLAPGSYSVQVTDSNGNDTLLNFTLLEPPLLQAVALPADALCNGNPTGSVLLSGQGGSPGYQYSLDGVSYVGSPSFAGLGPGNYTGFVSDQNGCIAMVPFVVNGQTVINLVLDSLVTGLCPDELASVFFSANGGLPPYTFNLAGGIGQTSGTFSSLSAGNYSMEVRDQNGCLTSQPFTIAEIPPLNPGFSIAPPPCIFPALVSFLPEDVTLAFYTWSFGDGNSSNQTSPVHPYTAPGSYPVQLVVADANGCLDSISLNLDLFPLPIADFLVNPAVPGWIALDQPAFFTDQSQNAVSWQWTFGDGAVANETNPQHIYEVPGDYCVSLIVENANGCLDSTKQCSLEVLDESLFIPSAFTPNGDQLNDVFEMVASFVPDDFECLIYNRWGQLIFKSDVWGDFWEGTFQSQPVQEGVYTWRLEYNTLEGRLSSRQGTVTIIR